MSATEQELRDLYASLPDERLAAMALRGKLTPDADRAMAAELQRRGISDLSPWKQEIDRDVAVLDDRRERHLNRASFARFFLGGVWYGLAILLAGFGAFTLVAHPEEGGWILGLILMGLAAAMAGVIWLLLKIDRLWLEKFVLRPWWR
jgi:hypothetical protein